MIDGNAMTVKIPQCIRTLRLKVKAEAYPWLNAAAVEVNLVWNWSNETSYKAARPFAGPGQWLTGFDLDKLAAGASECFEHIGSGTIQRVNAEFARRRRQFQKAKLRWRVSRGARRSLGWIPFKATQRSEVEIRLLRARCSRRLVAVSSGRTGDSAVGRQK
jgi:putative transposase